MIKPYHYIQSISHYILQCGPPVLSWFINPMNLARLLELFAPTLLSFVSPTLLTFASNISDPPWFIMDIMMDVIPINDKIPTISHMYIVIYIYVYIYIYTQYIYISSGYLT